MGNWFAKVKATQKFDEKTFKAKFKQSWNEFWLISLKECIVDFNFEVENRK